MTSQPSYDFIVSHFLALDHIGHSTSTIHSEIMDLKIKKISAFMERIMREMDNDTVLFVTGDHGMREDGNHGGSTES
jgi:GPI ethanolamine phosphate transferase 3 subunit O